MVCAISEKDLQSIVNAFEHTYPRLGLSVNVKKTEILYQPAPGQANASPSLKINGSVLKNVEFFPYLGSFLSVKADIHDGIQHRLRVASYAFGRMHERVFEERGIITDTKVKIYLTIIRLSLSDYRWIFTSTSSRW